jgi:secreted trypsin-like serine protease
MRNRLAALVASLTLAAACGGSSPSAPATPPPTVPVTSACSAVTQAVSSSTAIVNGSDCSTDNSSVVLLNMKDATGQQSGSCSGTVIAPRAVLTAAHCLQPPAASVLVFLGSGPQQTASSFAAHPSWRESAPSQFDVGVVLMPADIGRTPKPLLLSRDARVGETAVMSGWGKDGGSGVGATLRAGTATITAVTTLTLQTTSTTTASAVCQGDSGGPILIQEGGEWAVAGVISANSTLACSFGDNFYANLRAPDNMSFILGRVPDAARK